MQAHPLFHEEIARQRARELRAPRTIATGARTEKANNLAPIVQAAASGDEQAWSSLVQRFAPTLRGVVRGYRLGAADVDDVVQTVWASALSSIASLREPDAIAGWLCVIARREALRTLDRRRREVLVDASDLPEQREEATPETAIVEDERRRAVHAAVARLSDRQRTLATMLLHDPGISYTDVASRLAVPVGSIGPTRERALDRLRRDRGLAAVLSGPAGDVRTEAAES